MDKEKITYWSSSSFPSSNANIVNVIYMSDAIAKKFDLELFLFSNDSKIDFYGLKKHFNLKNYFRVKTVGLKYSFFKLISKFLFSKKTEIIYTRVLIIAVLASAFRKKVFFELHNKQFNFQNTFLFKLLLRFNRVKLIFITNELYLNYLKSYNLKNVDHIISPDASVSHISDSFKQKKKKSILNTNTKLKIGYFGSSHPGKGIEKVYKLSKKLLNFDFVIVGENRNISFTNKNLFVYPRISHIELLKIMKTCHIFLLPNSKTVKIHGKRDIGSFTSPLKLFEYFSSYGCVISSDLKVLKEVLNKENSFLIDFQNLQNAVDVIENLNNKRSLLISKSENSFQNFNDLYSWEKRVNLIFS